MNDRTEIAKKSPEYGAVPRGIRLEPFERWPRSGAFLVGAFLCEEMKPALRKEVDDFMQVAKQSYLAGNRRTLRSIRKDSLRTIWQTLADKEDMIYRRSMEVGAQNAFLKRWGPGFLMLPKFCK